MNVEQLLQEKNIKYRTQGQDYVIRCLHPEHEDIHPSLRIDRISGVFNCLSCGFKGSIFKHYGKQQAVVDIETAKVKKKINELLNNKILELPDLAVPFEYDYNHNNTHIKNVTLRKYEAFTVTEIKELEEKIVFPIRNLYGHIKAFCGRRLYSDVNPKYIFYPKHVSVPIFPNNPEVIDGSIILVEGIFDALNLIEKGLPNAVCAFGTSKFLKEDTLKKISYFNILGVTKIYIMFDGDEAGQKAANETETVLKRDFATETIELPRGVDPGNLVYEDIKLLRESLYEN
jgi:DNA primase